MAGAHLHETGERRDEPSSTGTAADRARDGGLVVFLWLLVILVAEGGLFLWLLERAYSR